MLFCCLLLATSSLLYLQSTQLLSVTAQEVSSKIATKSLSLTPTAIFSQYVFSFGVYVHCVWFVVNPRLTVWWKQLISKVRIKSRKHSSTLDMWAAISSESLVRCLSPPLLSQPENESAFSDAVLLYNPVPAHWLTPVPSKLPQSAHAHFPVYYWVSNCLSFERILYKIKPVVTDVLRSI